MFTGGPNDSGCSSAGSNFGEDKPPSQDTRDSILGPVPSRSEVEKAILDLQRFMQSYSASKSEFNGIKGLLHGHDSKMLHTPGFVRLRDAFNMMQSEPPLQNLVASLSCDKAVWEAILSNKAIQNLQAAAKEQKLLTSAEEPDITILIFRWIADFTKSKILELVEKFLLLINEILQPNQKEKPTSDLTDLMEDKVRSSFLLSVLIILIVVTTRSQG